MKKQSQKRLPHGVTQALVFDVLCRLSIGSDSIRTVSRAEILHALPQLSETTVDNRLHMLRQQKRILCEDGGYKPFIPIPKWRIPAMPRGTSSVVVNEAGSQVYLYWP